MAETPARDELAAPWPEARITTWREYHQPCGWSCAYKTDGKECEVARWLATLDGAALAAPGDEALDVERLAEAIQWVRRRYSTAPGYDEMYDAALQAITELLIGPYREHIAAKYAALRPAAAPAREPTDV